MSAQAVGHLPVWQYPRRHSLLQRLRTSEAQRIRHGSSQPPAPLLNADPIPAVRHTRCQFIEGDPRAGALICGEPTMPGRSWCRACCSRVFEPPKCGR